MRHQTFSYHSSEVVNYCGKSFIDRLRVFRAIRVQFSTRAKLSDTDCTEDAEKIFASRLRYGDRSLTNCALA